MNSQPVLKSSFTEAVIEDRADNLIEAFDEALTGESLEMVEAVAARLIERLTVRRPFCSVPDMGDGTRGHAAPSPALLTAPHSPSRRRRPGNHRDAGLR